MANVEFTTDGLFLTLGNMMPPLRDTAGFADDEVAEPLPCGIALMLATVADDDVAEAPAGPAVLMPLPVGVVDGYVVMGSGGSVKSSKMANLEVLQKKMYLEYG